jgi:hypothetical protein
MTSMRRWGTTSDSVSPYARVSGGGYGFASRIGIEIHLGVVPGDDRRPSPAYPFGDNADDLAAERRSAGVKVHAPQDTE